MSEIFSHEDSDGDGFYLRSRGDSLKFRAAGLHHSILAREDVARLRDALTEWLGDGEAPSTPAPMDPEMVRGIVREIVQDELRRIQVPGTVPIKASLLTEETPENIWGTPCATCGHSTGVHLPDLGCEHPDGCECAWPDTSAPAPEPASAPECVCPHRIRMHGPEAGCVECECTWTRSAP